MDEGLDKMEREVTGNIDAINQAKQAEREGNKKWLDSVVSGGNDFFMFCVYIAGIIHFCYTSVGNVSP